LAVYRVASTEGGLVGVSDAVRTWQEDIVAGRAGPHAAIEITDDAVYEERLRIELEPGQQLEIRAAEGCRPVLRPVDRQRNRPQSLLVEGHAAGPQAGPPPSVILDGVWVAGHCVELAGELGTVTVRHCTLVPGRDGAEADRRSGEVQPSVIVRAAPCDLAVDHSIIGRVRVESPETASDPLPVTVTDSVIDGRDPAARALEGPDGEAAYAVLTLQRVTVLGGAHVHEIGLVQDAILTGPLRASRRQAGEVRYSYVPVGSATPQRTSCQPDGVLLAGGGPAARALAAARVAPRFDGLRLTDPAYARLASSTAAQITGGASDEGEMGAYHDLCLGIRIGSLEARIRDFTPVGADIGVLFAS
jgi:hypothetical protein